MYEDIAYFIPITIAVVLLLISWTITKLFPNSKYVKKVKGSIKWIVDGLDGL